MFSRQYPNYGDSSERKLSRRGTSGSRVIVVVLTGVFYVHRFVVGATRGPPLVVPPLGAGSRVGGGGCHLGDLRGLSTRGGVGDGCLFLPAILTPRTSALCFYLRGRSIRRCALRLRSISYPPARYLFLARFFLGGLLMKRFLLVSHFLRCWTTSSLLPALLDRHNFDSLMPHLVDQYVCLSPPAGSTGVARLWSS